MLGDVVADRPAGSVSAVIDPEMLDREACRAWWLRRLHPGGPCCPECGTCVTDRQRETWQAGGRVACHGCGTSYTWRSGTVFAGREIDERQLYLFAALYVTGRFRIAEVATACRLSPDTIRRWVRRLQEVERG